MTFICDLDFSVQGYVETFKELSNSMSELTNSPYLYLSGFRTQELGFPPSKLLTHCYRYLKLRKTFGKFCRSYSELLSKFGEISFQEYVSEGTFHLVFYGDLVYILKRVKCEENFISSGSKIFQRLQRRKYDQGIIEKTIGLVLDSSTAFVQIFPILKYCTLTV